MHSEEEQEGLARCGQEQLIMILMEILPGCEEGEWDSDWDEETSDDHPNINKEKNMMFV